MILAAEKIEDCSALNAGRDDRITLNQVAELVFEITRWRPKEETIEIPKEMISDEECYLAIRADIESY